MKKLWPLVLLLFAGMLVLDFPGAVPTDAGRDDGAGTAGVGASDGGESRARGTREREAAQTQKEDGANSGQSTIGSQGRPPTNGDNLLNNPDFADAFSGWNSVNGHWRIHPTNCDPDIWPPEMAEMDQDKTDSGIRGWKVGQEDRLWQDVAVPVAHDELSFTLYESHHMREGIAEIRIYGSDDGDTWTEVWHRPQPEESAYGAGKGCEPVPGFSYDIPVSHSYNFYRLEFHGKMVVENDGWIFSWLSLGVSPVLEATVTPTSDDGGSARATPTPTALQTTPVASLTPTAIPTTESDRSSGNDLTPTSTSTPKATSTLEPTATSHRSREATLTLEQPDRDSSGNGRG